MNSLKKGEGVPLLNFEGGPGVPLLNFEGGPGVPLLNFRGVPGPTFKLWEGSRVPRFRVPLLHHARIMKSTSMWITMENFRFLKPLCTRGSLMTQFTNLDIERNLQYIFTSNKMLVIHKWSRRYTNKHSAAKQVLGEQWRHAYVQFHLLKITLYL